MSMKKWSSSACLALVDLKNVQFWVQVHDLGLEQFSIDNVKMIGGKDGNFIEADEDVKVPRNHMHA